MSYGGKEKEFVDWCAKHFAGPHSHTVTANKLHQFLLDCVIGRAKRNSKPKESESADDDLVNCIGYGTIEQYVSAIKALYSRQVALGENDEPDPYNKAVKTLLKNAQLEEVSLQFYSPRKFMVAYNEHGFNA